MPVPWPSGSPGAPCAGRARIIRSGDGLAGVQEFWERGRTMSRRTAPKLPCAPLVALLTAFPATTFGLASGQGMAAEGRDALGSRIDALFEAWDLPDAPGASIAVLRAGELLHSAGYGCAQLEYGVPIEADTVFHVASVSKQFTAMAVALLAAEGRLSLDDELREHVAEVPDFGQPLTLRHVLHHTSGLRDQWESFVIAGGRLDDVIRQSDVLGIVARQRELNFPPGTRHLYCNTGYTLAAEVVARVAGQPFPDFTRERIFEPLGMTSTHFHDDHRRVVRNRAYSYAKADGGFENRVLSFANAGATSLFTTAPDAVRWLDNLDHQRVGGPAVIEMLTRRGVLAGGEEIDYALGLVHGKHRGWATLSHGGADAGFRSYLVWFPQARLGIAVFSNLEGFQPGSLALQVAEWVLADEEPPEPEARTAASLEAEGQEPDRPAKPRDAVALPAESLEAYCGPYRGPDGIACAIERTNRWLFLRCGERSRRRLYVESATELVDGSGELRVSVDLDGAGHPRSLDLEAEGRCFHLARVAADSPPAPSLDAYAGRYFCEELRAVYDLELSDGKLVARHIRHGEIPLVPRWIDEFQGSEWFFARLRFERDEKGRIRAFRLDGSRVLNLLFTRMER